MESTEVSATWSSCHKSTSFQLPLWRELSAVRHLLRHLSTGYKHQSGKERTKNICSRRRCAINWAWSIDFCIAPLDLWFYLKADFLCLFCFSNFCAFTFPISLSLSLLPICGSIYMFRTGSPVRFAVAIKGNSLKRLPTAQWPLVACKVNLSLARVSEAAKA